MDAELSKELLIQVAQNMPATAVLAFVAWRLDHRLAVLSHTIHSVLLELAGAALAK